MMTAQSANANTRLRSLLQELGANSPEHKIDPSLANFQSLLGAMGDPQLSLQTIMVGGTNGKTSTARILESLALMLGFSTGVYTSPHLADPRERIRINDHLVASGVFCDAIDRVIQYAALRPTKFDRPTYFETLTAAAFEIFADVPVDLAVLEVGMGGKWDATNMTDPIAACLLPISLDHMRYLGNTIEKIAIDKSHIIKADSTAVVATQAPEVLEIIQRRCDKVGASLLYQGRDFDVSKRVDGVGGQSFDVQTPKGHYQDLFLPLLGAHQATNAAVALTAIEQTTPLDEAIFLPLATNALAQVLSPGRLEIVGQGPLFIVDACHNPAGAEVTANAIAQLFALNSFILIFGVMNDKDALKVLRPLIKQCVALVVVATDSPRATEVASLSAVAKEYFLDLPVYEALDVASACQQATDLALRHSDKTGVLAAGSVALAGAVREWALDE